jgi:hypothetical protein
VATRPPRVPPKKNRKKIQEEEFGWKISKKIQRKRHPMFKPPELPEFQIAARKREAEGKGAAHWPGRLREFRALPGSSHFLRRRAF